jgi:hypothetical protein
VECLELFMTTLLFGTRVGQGGERPCAQHRVKIENPKYTDKLAARRVCPTVVMTAWPAC